MRSLQRGLPSPRLRLRGDPPGRGVVQDRPDRIPARARIPRAEDAHALVVLARSIVECAVRARRGSRWSSGTGFLAAGTMRAGYEGARLASWPRVGKSLIT